MNFLMYREKRVMDPGCHFLFVDKAFWNNCLLLTFWAAKASAFAMLIASDFFLTPRNSSVSGLLITIFLIFNLTVYFGVS